MCLQSIDLINLDHKGWIGDLPSWGRTFETEETASPNVWRDENIFKNREGGWSSMRKLDAERKRAWIMKGLECWKKVCPCSFFIRGCLVWIKLLALVERVEPLECEFLPFTKLLVVLWYYSCCHQWLVTVLTSLYYCSYPSLVRRIPHPTQDAVLTLAHLWYLFKEIKQPKY